MQEMWDVDENEERDVKFVVAKVCLGWRENE